MDLTPKKINLFLLLKLPAAYFCGVRVKEIDRIKCAVMVRHGWRNQNPFKSIYFAVQEMAAELSTGALVMAEIKESQRSISMLVVSNRSSFSKKATGIITFVCTDRYQIAEAIAETVSSGEGVNITLKSIGTNEKGEKVSEMEFDWSIRLKVSPSR